MGKKRKQRDAIEEWIEYQDHIFDPGYWAGRIPPGLLGKRPNKGGYLLVAAGTINLALLLVPLLASAVASGTLRFDWSGVLAIGFFGGLSALLIASGIVLLRDPRRGSRSGG
jgi:hypothetical protein